MHERPYTTPKAGRGITVRPQARKQIHDASGGGRKDGVDGEVGEEALVRGFEEDAGHTHILGEPFYAAGGRYTACLDLECGGWVKC